MSSRKIYRNKYTCPCCHLSLGHVWHIFNKIHIRSSILKNNLMPKICPNCGKRLYDMPVKNFPFATFAKKQ